MKIAVISMIRDNWGGSEELWYAMAKTALKEGHSVTHVSYATDKIHPKMQELISLGLQAYTRPTYRRSGNPFLDIFRLAANFVKKRTNNALATVFRQQPDVVIYNGTCYSIAGEAELCRRVRDFDNSFFILGHFIDENASVSESELSIIRDMYGRCKKVFFVANRAMKYVRLQLGLDLKNAVLVRNPVNLRDLAIVPFPTARIAQLAMVGNLVFSHKGQDIAIQTLQKPGWKQRELELNIYGSGIDENRLLDMIKKQGEGQITVFGKVSDIRELWKKNQLLLMPSRMEGMPLAVVEAMICGRPAVVTDVGDMTEWIEEGKTGFIAREATVESVSDALERAWQARHHWEEMGRQAHKRAMELIDPDPGKTLLQLIQE